LTHFGKGQSAKFANFSFHLLARFAKAARESAKNRNLKEKNEISQIIRGRAV